MKVVIGTMETRHFDFTFVAESEEEVVEEAKRAWARHCETYTDADPNYFDDYGIESEINMIVVDKMPMSFRDHERV